MALLKALCGREALESVIGEHRFGAVRPEAVAQYYIVRPARPRLSVDGEQRSLWLGVGGMGDLEDQTATWA